MCLLSDFLENDDDTTGYLRGFCIALASPSIEIKDNLDWDYVAEFVARAAHAIHCEESLKEKRALAVDVAAGLQQLFLKTDRNQRKSKPGGDDAK